MPGSQRQAILVLGMHRSGTSAVAGAINLLGAAAPLTMIPAAADNPSGFFEAFSVIGVNDWLLNAGGGSWYDTLGYHSGMIDARTRSIALALVNFSIIADFKHAALFLLKDPRLCLLLDFWLPVLNASGIATSALLVLRSPDDIVASLAQRDAYPPQLAQALWLQHMLEAERATRGHSRSVIPYEELLRDWQTPLSRAATQAAIEWPNTIDAAGPEIQNFLDIGLRHHHDRPGMGGGPGTLGALAEEVYELLHSLVTGPSDDTTIRRLDDIRAIFADWRRRDAVAISKLLLRGHRLREQPPMDLPAGWLELAESLTQGINLAR